MQEQHLDHYGIEFGVLNPLAPSGQGDQNSDFSAALAYANNEAQLAALDAPATSGCGRPSSSPTRTRKPRRAKSAAAPATRISPRC